MDASASKAAAAAGVSLILCVASIACFIPPLSERVLGTPLLTVALGVAIGVSALLHLVFVGLTAQRMGRRAWPWVLLALLVFPVASIIGLVLLEWQRSDAAPAKPVT